MQKRYIKNKVKTAKGRKLSSTTWLQRQLNDPYVMDAKDSGYRSRAAYKLIEIDKKFNLLKKSKRIIDIGAAPGGWSQVASKLTNQDSKIIAIDLVHIEPIAKVDFFQGDFLEENSLIIINQKLNAKADLIMSDMASSSCGHPATDHIRIMMLCEAAFIFATQVLNKGGNFIAKILKGGTEDQLLNKIKKKFTIVKHYKPPASRVESAESYLIALGFKDD